MRILKEGHDRRFNNVRDSPGTFFVYWTIQGTWKLYECFVLIAIVLDQLSTQVKGVLPCINHCLLSCSLYAFNLEDLWDVGFRELNAFGEWKY